MNCSKCGCELTEGYSRFCPECGTPVDSPIEKPQKEPVVINKKTENKKLENAFRIVIGVLTVISVVWMFFPLLRAPGKEITTLSAFNLITGKNNFDGMKIGGMPLLAIIFLLPQIFSLVIVFIKKLEMHRMYAMIGLFQLYKSVVSVSIWALVINICDSYLHGEYAYGLGFVVDIIFSLIIGFLCISLSASQKTSTERSKCWLSTAGIYNIILLALLGISHIAGLVLAKAIREIWPYTILAMLSSASGIWAYLSIIKKDFSNWLVILIHSIITLATHISLYFYANSMVNNFAGKNDFLDIVEVGSVYVSTFVICITVFATIYNASITVWTYKLLKRPLKHR